MKKNYVFLTLAFSFLVLSLISTSFVFAAESTYPSYLLLFQKAKDAEGNWHTVEGASGMLEYYPIKPAFKFYLTAQGLKPSKTYKLIYYPDPYPGNGLRCLGTGTTNVNGNLTIDGLGSTIIDDGEVKYTIEGIDLNANLPIPADDNYPDGAKIWLVLQSYVDCAHKQLTGWPLNNQTGNKILFEAHLITYKDNLIPRITFPNGGETLKIGQQYNIRWATTGTRCFDMVELLYTTDGGTTWDEIDTIIGGCPYNPPGPTWPTGYLWTVPNTPSVNCKVKVIMQDEYGMRDLTSDMSNKVLTIAP